MLRTCSEIPCHTFTSQQSHGCPNKEQGCLRLCKNKNCAILDRPQPAGAALHRPPDIRAKTALSVGARASRTLAPYSAPVLPYFWKMAVSTSAAVSAGSWPALSSTGTSARPVTSSARTCRNTARQQTHACHVPGHTVKSSTAN